MDKATVQELFKDVEKDENGSPVVLFRFGFQKVRFNGKFYILPLTKEEFEAEKKLHPLRDDVRDLNDEAAHIESGWCIGAGYTSCQRAGGCRQCRTVPIGTGWTCECNS